MKILKVWAENFQSYRKMELDLSDITVAGIVGTFKDNPKRSNGAGKSIIMDCVSYILYGKGRTVSEKGLIRRGEESMSGGIALDNNGKRVVIERGRNNGKPFLKLTIDGDDYSDNVDETQGKIVKLVGMDFDLFVATVYFQ